MARYGQLLLRRLTFQYCDRMGCSLGMRDYIEELMPAFAEQHPHVEVYTDLKRSKFPLVKAEYGLLPNDAAHLERTIRRQQQAGQQRSARKRQAASGPPRFNSNVIGTKNCSAKEIQEVVWWLSQSQCRPKTSRVPSKHIVSKQRSIQGTWTPTTF